MAFQQARALFPFPILGLDTDSGGEFINELLRNYCEAEQITFTRGRERLKEDQCYVEQKNGAVVRQFVGFDRLVGEQAYVQLREVYRAVRLYVNCFQPSMKLVGKESNAEHVRRVYDPAKTPWQRLALSGSLPQASHQYFHEVVQALDPLEVLHQLERLQQALRRCAAHPCPPAQRAFVAPILSFCVDCCFQGAQAFQERTPSQVSVLDQRDDEPSGRTGLLDWPRTMRDPFEGQWELILSLVLAHSDWSGNDLFQEMQRRFPGRYRPAQQSTLHLGLRKIRARLLSIIHEPWPQEVLQSGVPSGSAGAGSASCRAGEKTEVVPVLPTCLAVLAPQEPEGDSSMQLASLPEEAISSSSELCALRLGDVDREQRGLRVQEKEGKERRVALSPNAWYQLLSYVENYRPKEGLLEGGDTQEEHLFLLEWYRPLTSNSITLLFDRLRKRAGISDKPVSPLVLRDTFAVRYLQAGGTLEALRDILGLRDLAALKRYADLSTHKSKNEPSKLPEEESSDRPKPTRQTRRRRRRRTTSAASRTHQPRKGSRPDGSLGKEPASGAEDDP